MIRNIQDVKDTIVRQLTVLGFEKIETHKLLSKKLSNIYQLITDNIMILVALDKEGDKNCLEIISYTDGDDGVERGIKLYDDYVNLLLAEKSERGYVKTYILDIVNRICESFKEN